MNADRVAPFPGPSPKPARPIRKPAVAVAVAALVVVLLAGGWLWQGLQPIDREQRIILRALVHDVARIEGLTPQKVWAQVKAPYGVARHADIQRRDYDATLAALLDRAAR